jgi:N-glycosylase/DNA lyase
MDRLVKEIGELRQRPVRKRIDSRLKSFASFRNKGTRQWFSELCFCILTANSKGRNAYNIQRELGARGFCECAAGDIRSCIQRHRHRFHNNKTRFIIDARKHIDIKAKIQQIVNEQGEFAAREWLVKNISGLGWKESSHFLRNVGCKNLAIIDRHVLNIMDQYSLARKPKTMTKKTYLKFESILQKLADRLSMTQAELDMYLWYMRTGDVLK